MKHLKSINEGMGNHQALQIVNDKLQELGIDVKLNNLGSTWGGRKGDIKFVELDLPRYMKHFFPKAKLRIKTTFDSDYHSTYNSNPSITLWVELYYREERKSQILYDYPLEMGKWKSSHIIKWKDFYN